MIKKYNEYIKEGLSTFLKGPTEEEIADYYKDLYLSGKMNILLYYRKSSEFGFKGPDKKEVSDYLKKLYDNKKLSIDEYYENLKKNNLDVPSKSFLWKEIGSDKEFNNPEEYFLYLTDGIDIVSPNGLYYEWIGKDGKILFEQYINPEKLIFANYSNTYRIYTIIFDMDFNQIYSFIKEMFNKHFSDKINISEYGFRINYNR